MLRVGQTTNTANLRARPLRAMSVRQEALPRVALLRRTLTVSRVQQGANAPARVRSQLATRVSSAPRGAVHAPSAQTTSSTANRAQTNALSAKRVPTLQVATRTRGPYVMRVPREVRVMAPVKLQYVLAENSALRGASVAQNAALTTSTAPSLAPRVLARAQHALPGTTHREAPQTAGPRVRNALRETHATVPTSRRRVLSGNTQTPGGVNARHAERIICMLIRLDSVSVRPARPVRSRPVVPPPPGHCVLPVQQGQRAMAVAAGNSALPVHFRLPRPVRVPIAATTSFTAARGRTSAPRVLLDRSRREIQSTHEFNAARAWQVLRAMGRAQSLYVQGERTPTPGAPRVLTAATTKSMRPALGRPSVRCARQDLEQAAARVLAVNTAPPVQPGTNAMEAATLWPSHRIWYRSVH